MLCPCKCSSFVHLGCLQEWINRRRHSKCEICLETYKVRWIQTRNLSLRKFLEHFEEDKCDIIRKLLSLFLSVFLVLFFSCSFGFNLWDIQENFETSGIYIFFCLSIGVCFVLFLYILIKLIVENCLVLKVEI